MSLVGTIGGVFKVGTIKRKPDGEQWSFNNVKNLIGSPQRPQPGIDSRRITAFAKKKIESVNQELAELRRPSVASPELRSVRITKHGVRKHGETFGCAGRRAVMADRSWKAAHSPDCRRIIESAMASDPDGKRRLDLADNRTAQRIVDNSEEAEEEEN